MSLYSVSHLSYVLKTFVCFAWMLGSLQEFKVRLFFIWACFPAQHEASFIIENESEKPDGSFWVQDFFEWVKAPGSGPGRTLIPADIVERTAPPVCPMSGRLQDDQPLPWRKIVELSAWKQGFRWSVDLFWLNRVKREHEVQFVMDVLCKHICSLDLKVILLYYISVEMQHKEIQIGFFPKL